MGRRGGPEVSKVSKVSKVTKEAKKSAAKQFNSDGIGGDTEKSGAGVAKITPPRKERQRANLRSLETRDASQER